MYSQVFLFWSNKLINPKNQYYCEYVSVMLMELDRSEVSEA